MSTSNNEVDDDIFETKSTRSALSGDERSTAKDLEDDADSYSEKSFKGDGSDDDSDGEAAGGSASEADDGLQNSDNEVDSKPVAKKLAKAKKSIVDSDEDENVDKVDFGDSDGKKKKKKAKKVKKSFDEGDGEEKQKKKKRKNADGDSPDKKKKKKPKSTGKKMGLNFFADEAHEAEEESDDDVYGEEYEGVDPTADMTQDEIEAMRRVDERNQKLNQWKELTAEQIADQFDQRHRSERMVDRAYKHMDLNTMARGQSQAFTQLPTIHDPKIYKLRCKIGQEQVAIRSLMLKAADMRNKEHFSRIKSAFCGNSKGYIFIEAVSEMLMRELINGLRMIFSNSIVSVPLSEMTSVLHVTIQKKPLQEHQFVRFSRGPLKGDLARIIGLYDGGEVAVVQAVPRPVYSEEERQNKKGIKKDNSVRPPQRLFDQELAKAAEQSNNPNGALYLNTQHLPRDLSHLSGHSWQHEVYYKGFLIKQVNVNTYLQTKDVSPSLEELKWFQSHELNIDDPHDPDDENNSIVGDTSAADKIAKEIELLSTRNNGSTANTFVVGDLVKVVGGELQNVVGRVVSVHGDRQLVKMVSLDKTFLGTMEIEMSLLMKFVEIGAHVKVMAGQFMGQSGRVVSMSSVGGTDQVAAILTDGIQQEIQCNTSYLQLTDEISVGSDQLGGYKLHDLVALNDNESAVIINVGINKLRVINQNGNVKDIYPQEVRYKQNTQSQRASELDSKQNRVKLGDLLQVDMGPHAKQSGTIKHIAKHSVWLHNNLYHKDNGIFVVKARNCSLVGGSNNAATDFTPNYATSNQRVRPSNPPSSVGNASTNYTPATVIVDEIRIGASVKIVKGAYRSLIGTVLDVNGSFVMVQLDAKMKKVSLQKDALKLNVAEDAMRYNDAVGGAMPNYNNNNNNAYNPYAAPDAFIGADTPHLASQTPSYYGGETPRVGAETPSFGNFTPYNSMSGAATPSHSGESNPWRVTKDDYEQPSTASSSSFRGGSVTPMSDRNYPTSNTLTPSSLNYSTNHNYGGASSSSAGGDSSYSRAHFDTPSMSMATTTPSIAPTSVVNTANVAYEVGMVVQGKAGDAMGKRCVIVAVTNDNSYQVKVRDGMGRLIGDEITLTTDGFKLADPVKNQPVKFISGKNLGATATVRGVTGKDAMVIVDGETEPRMVKCNLLAWIMPDINL